ncbi:MAG: hypothetical protein CVU55_06815 [Deltaproteobacteria bacterium HGW-Deltaproteobacteria-13]|jgi:hypothetical protein|nr:MAG: hypothetical protein CVU55_06815 [Deltaproteobacteria bacterium HGW-Deltaproteobacteria-13]
MTKKAICHDSLCFSTVWYSFLQQGKDFFSSRIKYPPSVFSHSMIVKQYNQKSINTYSLLLSGNRKIVEINDQLCKDISLFLFSDIEFGSERIPAEHIRD